MKLSKFNSKHLIIAAISLGVLFILGSFVYGRISESGIIFEVNSEADFATVGLPYEVNLMVSNDSDDLLKNSSISLQLPEDVIFASGVDKRIDVVDVGDIAPGEIKEKSFSVIFLQSESDERKLDAAFSYSFGALTAKFEKHNIVSVKTIDFPLDIEYVYPEKVLPGQEFEIEIKYKNVFDDILPVFKIVFDKPEAFSVSSTIPDIKQDSYWTVDSLPSGEEDEILINGSINLPDDSKFNVGFDVVLDLGGFTHSVISDSLEITITKPPLSMEITLPDDGEAYRLSEDLEYVLTYSNNSAEDIKNATVKVVLNGEMYDFESLESVESLGGASFSEDNKTIIWLPDNNPSLRVIPAGGSGTLSFSIKIADSYDISEINDKDFMVKADAKIEADSILGAGSIESKIAGAVEIESFGLFRDAESKILNDGVWPPKVDVPTEYTIHWRLTNFSTDISNIVVKAPLADGVVFTGEVKGATTESTEGVDSISSIKVDNGNVVWNLARASAIVGIIGKTPEVIFQVRSTPYDYMAGDYMNLLGVTNVEADDDFTGLKLTSSVDVVTTRLPNDSTVDENEGRVVR